MDDGLWASRRYSCHLVLAIQNAGDDVVGAHWESGVVQDRFELLPWEASVEHQQAAQLSVSVLLDDIVRFVPFEEFAHLISKREAANPHVVDLDPVRT